MQPSAEKAAVALLSRADVHPDRPDSVAVIETHFAWVFLSRLFAYKLKKPLRSHGFDLTSVAARRANCELEVSLNRRLAETVYLGVVPIVRSGGGLRLDAPGEPVDWLVKMRRLPAEKTLDRAAAAGAAAEADLERVVDTLVAFYARAARAPWDGPRYREQLTTTIERAAEDLAAPDLGLDAGCARATAAAQLRFVEERAQLLDDRIAAGRVVDAHGDLRPEHVFLCDPPQIIDCLEFSAELRLLDTAREIAFLALECERLGFGALGARIVELYRRRNADGAPPELVAFYTSISASVRALLAALHVRDRLSKDDELVWRRRARWYLDVAEHTIAGRAPSTPPDARHSGAALPLACPTDRMSAQR